MGILSVKNVDKNFGGLKALDNVNLEVEAGTVHAIIGPNGAGKSTLLDCFVGRLEPDTGTVTFDGQSLLGRRSQLMDATLYLNWKDGVFDYGSKVSSRLYICRANRDVGTMATG